MAGRERRRERIASALGVAILHALLGYLLVTGSGIATPGGADRGLKVFDVPAPPPPPPPEQDETEEPSEREEGAAAPPDLEAEPSPVAAPVPEIPLPVPPPVVAAPPPGPGIDPDAGAAERPGPGTGAGGTGTGTGAGGPGSGRGGGGIAVRARHVSGRIVDDDYPRAASRARAEGSVLAHFTVGTDGRAGGCTVVRSSGHALLDATTCRLIERRFRFQPARGADGRPVPELRGWKQDWWLETPR